ncbi:MAG: LLM class F420-dependent oxidoreductase [Chloroflexi bacterium]|nr:MAG: LLM class F420-dependent oxidoreductase [Chloroflexota bacterium]TMD93893.1 MAG: LLM class F420-dependent oxidoreductase [Chloroflexota bacterium]
MPRRFKVGYQIHPQHCTVDEIRTAARRADELGADTVWVWDHMYPLYGPPDGSSHECWTLLAAIAVETRRAHIGALVCSTSYRNPELLAYMAGTLDHLSGGRAILGVGAGWFERDYTEYGYEFGDAPARLRRLGADLPRIRSRLERLPAPTPHRVPIMIGGGGEKVTLRLVARHADMWNTFPPFDGYARKCTILDDWCARIGRDPHEIERTMSIGSDMVDGDLDEALGAGATHLIIRGAQPFDMAPLERLIARAEGA